MKRILPFIVLILFISCKKNKAQSEETTDTATEMEVEAPADATIIPIEHATAILEWNGNTIYMDPVGSKEQYEGQKPPTLILITDIHGDHFSMETLQILDTVKATVIAPKAVADQIPADFRSPVIVMNNGEIKNFSGITVEAIPMYNLREEALNFHTKGRGNGYVLTLGKERLYFSGDTEDIPEMRALQNIDKAFVCMNLPFTMTEASAADAVLEFKPKEVYPYHYRGRPDVSDVVKFKTLVNEGDPNIKVVQLDWYPKDDF
ncbi:MAG: MBL fold metallo-hydrolase [Bacteroidota bacterium]|nr:MBL fold metallo-hydrolase [Bacteroidota bacterium]